jgi:hypothetical protein
MLRIQHCLDNRLIDGGKIVSLTHRPHFTRQKHYLTMVYDTTTGIMGLYIVRNYKYLEFPEFPKLDPSPSSGERTETSNVVGLSGY